MFEKIGIIGAMDEEVEKLIKVVDNVEKKEIAGMVYHEGKIGDKQVVVVKCGIGKINAAVCSQILIDIFKVDALINTGVAGSLNDDIEIGDIVISKDTLNHDMDTTGFGEEYGQIPRMDCSIFEADEKFSKLAYKAASSIRGESGVHYGRVLSGDQFISSQEKKDWLIETFKGDCAEMEGVAIGQTGYLNKIPFVIIRAISDKCHGGAKMDYETFKNKAIEDLSESVIAMVKEC